jgi:hypothetical protein
MCDTMVHVSADGVWFAKNSDRDPNEAQLLEWTTAADHAAGSRARCTWIDIPQVPHTHATMVSRPFWMWGAEMGANEHGVTIGNEAVFTDQPLADLGLTGMDLLRLALERSATAHEAVGVIVSLIETHGQGGGCGHENRSFRYHNSFLVADPTTAFVLETAGRLTATEQVTGGARSISNGLTIAPFAAAHADRIRNSVTACAARRAITEAATASAADRGAPALAAALRSHGPEAHAPPAWSPINGGLGAPCVHAGGLLTVSQTTASWIADLRTASAPQHWVTATAAPCTSIFKPVAVDTRLDLGPAPTDRDDSRTVWWRHERLHRSILTDPERLLPIIAPERDATEAAWFDTPPDSATAFADAATLEARWLAAVTAAGAEPGRSDHRPPLVRHVWRVRNRRAGLQLSIDASPASPRSAPPRR